MKLHEILEAAKWDDPVDLLAVRGTDRDPVGRKFGPKTKQKILKKDIINAKGRHGPKGNLPDSDIDDTDPVIGSSTQWKRRST